MGTLRGRQSQSKRRRDSHAPRPVGQGRRQPVFAQIRPSRPRPNVHVCPLYLESRPLGARLACLKLTRAPRAGAFGNALTGARERRRDHRGSYEMRTLRLVTMASVLACATSVTAGDIAPGGTLRAAYLGTNPAQAMRDPATGEIRGPAYDLARELAPQRCAARVQADR